MLRLLYGHHQAYQLNNVIKTLSTLLGSQLYLQFNICGSVHHA